MAELSRTEFDTKIAQNLPELTGNTPATNYSFADGRKIKAREFRLFLADLFDSVVLTDVTANTTPNDADQVFIQDSAGNIRKITRANFLTGITSGGTGLFSTSDGAQTTIRNTDHFYGTLANGTPFRITGANLLAAVRSGLATSTQLSALASRVTTAEANITSNDTDITALSTRITTNATNITSNDTDISALATRVTSLENAPAGGGSGVGFPTTENVITSSADVTVTASAHVNKHNKFTAGSPNITLNNSVGTDDDIITFTNDTTGGVISIISDNAAVGTITLRRGGSATYVRDNSEWINVSETTRGSVPQAPAPAIVSFSIAGWGTDVPAGNLGGTRRVSWSVSNAGLVRGNLTLTANGRVISTALSPTGSPQNLNLGTINLGLNGAASALLSGTSTTGRSFSRGTSVSVTDPVYYGVSTAQAITDTIASGANKAEYSSGSQDLDFPAWTGDRYLFYAQRSALADITGIGEGVQERITAFQKQAATITISSTSYEVWVSRFEWLPDADGVTLSFSK